MKVYLLFEGSVTVEIHADPNNDEEWSDAISREWGKIPKRVIADCADLTGHEIAPTTYVIGGEFDDETGEPLYWSNQDGWVSLAQATRFTDEEQQTLNLPIGGEWEPEP